MSRNYGKLKEHEKEILKLRGEGNSHQAIANKLGFSNIHMTVRSANLSQK